MQATPAGRTTLDAVDRTRFADIPCSVSRAAGAIADPWTLLVLRDLFLGLRRFEELRQDLGIATNILTARLDHLVAERLVERRRYHAHPPRDEYLLTDAGRDLHGIVLALLAWGDRHRPDPMRRPAPPPPHRLRPPVPPDRHLRPLRRRTRQPAPSSSPPARAGARPGAPP